MVGSTPPSLIASLISLDGESHAEYMLIASLISLDGEQSTSVADCLPHQPRW